MPPFAFMGVFIIRNALMSTFENEAIVKQIRRTNKSLRVFVLKGFLYYEEEG